MISLKGMRHVFPSGSKHKVSIQVQNCISTNTINFLRNKEHVSFRIKKVDPSNSIIVVAPSENPRAASAGDFSLVVVFA